MCEGNGWEGNPSVTLIGWTLVGLALLLSLAYAYLAYARSRWIAKRRKKR